MTAKIARREFFGASLPKGRIVHFFDHRGLSVCGTAFSKGGALIKEGEAKPGSRRYCVRCVKYVSGKWKIGTSSERPVYSKTENRDRKSGSND